LRYICDLLKTSGVPLKNTIPTSNGSGDKLKGRAYSRKLLSDGSIEYIVHAVRFKSPIGDIFRAFFCVFLIFLFGLICAALFGALPGVILGFISIFFLGNLFKYKNETITIYPGKGIAFLEHTVPFSDVESVNTNTLGQLMSIYLFSNGTKVTMTAGHKNSMEPFFEALRQDIQNEF